MTSVGNKADDLTEPRRKYAAVGAVLLLALVVLHWLDQEPVERLQLEMPANATFRYSRWVSQTGDDFGLSTVDVPRDTGRTILDLVNGSERYVPEQEWHVHLGWPPVYKTVPILESLSPWYTLDVLPPDSEVPLLRIEFVNETRFFTPAGKHLVPLENRPELRRLLDVLDEECWRAYEQQLGELPDSDRSDLRGDSPGDRDGSD